MTPLPPLSAPAQRALEAAGIRLLEDLAKVSELELENMHGIGHKAMRALQDALLENKLSLRQD